MKQSVSAIWDTCNIHYNFNLGQLKMKGMRKDEFIKQSSERLLMNFVLVRVWQFLKCAVFYLKKTHHNWPTE